MEKETTAKSTGDSKRRSKKQIIKDIMLARVSPSQEIIVHELLFESKKDFLLVLEKSLKELHNVYDMMGVSIFLKGNHSPLKSNNQWTTKRRLAVCLVVKNSNPSMNESILKNCNNHFISRFSKFPFYDFEVSLLEQDIFLNRKVLYKHDKTETSTIF